MVPLVVQGEPLIKGNFQMSPYSKLGKYKLEENGDVLQNQ